MSGLVACSRLQIRATARRRGQHGHKMDRRAAGGDTPLGRAALVGAELAEAPGKRIRERRARARERARLGRDPAWIAGPDSGGILPDGSRSRARYAHGFPFLASNFASLRRVARQAPGRELIRLTTTRHTPGHGAARAAPAGRGGSCARRARPPHESASAESKTPTEPREGTITRIALGTRALVRWARPARAGPTPPCRGGARRPVAGGVPGCSLGD